jgi:NADH-quinone oxidoreductase subunit L
MHHEQDMRKMGGLRHRMPVTYWTSLIGALALIGTPFFSGFYSKDALIEAVSESHRAGAGYAYVCVLLGVFITALYTFRMIFMTFHGKERLDHHAQDHFHDVGWDMKAPLVALAIPSLLIGFFTIQPVLFGNYFGSAIQVAEHNDVVAEIGHHFEGPVAFALHGPLGAPFWLALSGVVCAWLFFLRYPSWAAAVQSRLTGLHTLLVNKYYFDWFNENVLARASRGLGTVLWKAGDQAVIDGTLVNGSAAAVNWFAGIARRIQTGYLYSYALWMVVGLAVLLGWFLLKAH